MALRVTTDTGAECFFMTWGRIQDPLDPSLLEAILLEKADSFHTPGVPVQAQLCGTLQEARDAPHFYEGFFAFCQEAIPYGDGYEEWRAKMDERMRAGRDIYFLGSP